MSTLLIAEHNQQALDAIGARAPMAMLPPLAEQSVTFTSTSVQSAALGSGTSFVMLTPDADCRIAVGANPTALVTGSVKLFANQSVYFGVTPGHKIAVVAG